MMLKTIAAAAAAIAFSGAALLADPASAASRVQATGVATSGKLVPYFLKKAKAERTAVQNWNSRVTRIYGHRFANWNQATAKNTTCNRVSSTRVSCRVSAVPQPARYGRR
ncbi:hypothetical protein ACO2I3_10225 [Leptospira interrogans]